jgi:hypothetical protein
MKKLIMLSGKKRSGKDTSAILMKQLDPSIKLLAFATPLKQIMAATFNIPMPILEEWKNDGFVCMHGIPMENQENADFQMQTYREILQNFGTEAMKPVFGNEVWSMLAVKRIKELFQYTDTVVVTDWRFEVEYDYIYDAFCESKNVAHGTAEVLTIALETWRIERPDVLSEDSHSSETALDNFEFDKVIINGGTIEDLKENIKGELNV